MPIPPSPGDPASGAAPTVAALLASPLDGALVDGLTLRRLAERALAGLPVVDPEQTPGDAVLVIHDPACPSVPATFVRDLVEACRRTGRSQVAVLAVTDTVKVTDGAVVGETLDRDTLATIASPIVLPPGVRPPGRDVAGIVEALRAGSEIDLVEAPAQVVRLMSAGDVAFLPSAGPAIDPDTEAATESSAGPGQ